MTTHATTHVQVRTVAALVLALLALPLVAAGLIDPLEGGFALLGAAGLALLAWAAGRIPPPRLAWIAWLVTMGVGIAALAIAVYLNMQGQRLPAGQGLLALPWPIIALLAVYEAGVVATFAGGVWFVARLARGLRRPTQ